MMTHSQTQPQLQTTFKLDLCSVAKLQGIEIGLIGMPKRERVWADNKNPKQIPG
jgi:hypothetical protein